MQLLLSPVELTLPGDSRFIRLARLVASGVATTCGLPLESVEDFRIVVDEVCSTLIETSDGAPVHLSFRMEQGALVVEGSTQTDPRREIEAARLTLSHQILDVLADTHRLDREGDRLTIVVSTARRAQGVG
jgi:serine/threonine-protein kinase RsbW